MTVSLIRMNIMLGEMSVRERLDWIRVVIMVRGEMGFHHLGIEVEFMIGLGLMLRGGGRLKDGGLRRGIGSTIMNGVMVPMVGMVVEIDHEVPRDHRRGEIPGLPSEDDLGPIHDPETHPEDITVGLLEEPAITTTTKIAVLMIAMADRLNLKITIDREREVIREGRLLHTETKIEDLDLELDPELPHEESHPQLKENTDGLAVLDEDLHHLEEIDDRLPLEEIVHPHQEEEETAIIGIMAETVTAPNSEDSNHETKMEERNSLTKKVRQFVEL